jgi:hypothetical protein
LLERHDAPVEGGEQVWSGSGGPCAQGGDLGAQLVYVARSLLRLKEAVEAKSKPERAQRARDAQEQRPPCGRPGRIRGGACARTGAGRRA